MTFLTIDDFKVVLLDRTFNKLVTENPGALEAAVEAAVDEVTSYITGRYDLGKAYGASGTDRNNILVMSLVDIALFHVYSAFYPNNIPDLRGIRYQNALDLFKGVSKGTRFLDLPLVEVIPEQKGYILFNSNPKFNF